LPESLAPLAGPMYLSAMIWNLMQCYQGFIIVSPVCAPARKRPDESELALWGSTSKLQRQGALSHLSAED